MNTCGYCEENVWHCIVESLIRFRHTFHNNISFIKSVTALAALYGQRAVGHFLSAEYARALLKRYVDSGAEFGQ